MLAAFISQAHLQLSRRIGRGTPSAEPPGTGRDPLLCPIVAIETPARPPHSSTGCPQAAMPGTQEGTEPQSMGQEVPGSSPQPQGTPQPGTAPARGPPHAWCRACQVPFTRLEGLTGEGTAVPSRDSHLSTASRPPPHPHTAGGAGAQTPPQASSATSGGTSLGSNREGAIRDIRASGGVLCPGAEAQGNPSLPASPPPAVPGHGARFHPQFSMPPPNTSPTLPIPACCPGSPPAFITTFPRRDVALPPIAKRQRGGATPSSWPRSGAAPSILSFPPRR